MAYAKTPEGRAAKARDQKKWRHTPAGHEATARARKKWKQTPAGREAKKRERKKWKQTHKERVRKSEKIRRAARAEEAWLSRPFAMVDGEGGGNDALGRQNYLLLRAGTPEKMSTLYTGEPLSSHDCLDFLLELDKGPIYFWFAGNYDATMILRDLPKPVIERIFSHDGFTYWGRYAIDYRPRQYLSVGQVDRNNRFVKGSMRTVNEVWGFFQSTFTRALETFQIGSERERIEIFANKRRRGEFTAIGETEDRYNALEIKLGCQLMDRFRLLVHGAGIKPRHWRGAGSLASALFRQNRVKRRKEQTINPSFMASAVKSYYGGRFEITAHGPCGDVHEYDIRSAYPAAMSALPCLDHGRWRNDRNRRGEETFRLQRVIFRGARTPYLYGLPVRLETGTLCWPKAGEGWYWGCELDNFEGTLEIIESWTYEQNCDCRPFAWIEDAYAQRLTVEKAGSKAQGYPLKLGINALYGKTAQRRPKAGPWTNYIHASLVTAMTRTKIVKAARQNPEAIVMIATDGIYSLAPLDLDIGDELGQWEHKLHHDFWVAQPGVWWSREKRRSRGIAATEFETAITQLEKSFSRWSPRRPMPTVEFPVVRFQGLRQATAQGNPAGLWQQGSRHINMDFSDKRSRPYRHNGIVRSHPRDEFIQSNLFVVDEKLNLLDDDMIIEYGQI